MDIIHRHIPQCSGRDTFSHHRFISRIGVLGNITLVACCVRALRSFAGTGDGQGRWALISSHRPGSTAFPGTHTTSTPRTAAMPFASRTRSRSRTFPPQDGATCRARYGRFLDGKPPPSRRGGAPPRGVDLRLSPAADYPARRIAPGGAIARQPG